MIVEYIDGHKGQFGGVEPICRELQVAPPSTYYAAKTRPASARSVGDAELTEVITAEHAGELRGLRGRARCGSTCTAWATRSGAAGSNA